MSQEENKDNQPNPIQKLGEMLDEESPPTLEGPGVYYLTVDKHGEFYIIEQTSPIITDQAKSYGKQHPDYGGFCFIPLRMCAAVPKSLRMSWRNTP